MYPYYNPYPSNHYAQNPSSLYRQKSKIRYFHPGDQAPNFTLEGVEDLQLRSYSLNNYLGSWVLLFFYGSNFTFV